MNARPLLISTVLLLALPTGCATPPKVRVSQDLLSTAAHDGPAQRLVVLQREGERLARAPFLPGNTVELLIDGPAAFTALAEAIRSARVRVDVESYEFDGVAGGQFAPQLIETPRKRTVSADRGDEHDSRDDDGHGCGGSWPGRAHVAAAQTRRSAAPSCGARTWSWYRVRWA